MGGGDGSFWGNAGLSAGILYSIASCNAGGGGGSSGGGSSGSGGDTSAKDLIGKDFEEWLVKHLGGEGSFVMQGREFDGRLGNRWWEAKSGGYWNRLQPGSPELQKFQSDMGSRLNIAKKYNATYELHSNSPIPQHITQWLSSKGIQWFEHLE